MYNVISLVVQIWNLIPYISNFNTVPEQEDNHCDGRVNLQGTLNQLQGNNSDVSNHVAHCWSSS